MTYRELKELCAGHVTCSSCPASDVVQCLIERDGKVVLPSALEGDILDMQVITEPHGAWEGFER